MKIQKNVYEGDDFFHDSDVQLDHFPGIICDLWPLSVMMPWLPKQHHCTTCQRLLSHLVIDPPNPPQVGPEEASHSRNPRGEFLNKKPRDFLNKKP